MNTGGCCLKYVRAEILQTGDGVHYLESKPFAYLGSIFPVRL